MKAEPPEGSPSRSLRAVRRTTSRARPQPLRSGPTTSASDRSSSRDDEDILELCSACRRDGAHPSRAGVEVASDSTSRRCRASFPRARRVRSHAVRAVRPWADYLADDLVLMALGGSMSACGYRPDRRRHLRHSPARIHGRPGMEDGFDLRGHRDASRPSTFEDRAAGSERGQFIDVSAHECSASMTEWHLLSYICSGFRYRRAPHPTLTAKDGRRIAALVPDFLGPACLRPPARDARGQRGCRPVVGPGVSRPRLQGGQLQRAVAGVETACRSCRRGGRVPHGPVRGAPLGSHPEPRRGRRRSAPAVARALRHAGARRARSGSRGV